MKAVKSGKREIRARYARKMKLVLAAGLVVNFGLLAAFKYLAFFGSIIDGACAAVGIPLNLELPVWAAPIGISFYTLMAGSYLIDVFLRHGGPRSQSGPCGAVPRLLPSDYGGTHLPLRPDG